MHALTVHVVGNVIVCLKHCWFLYHFRPMPPGSSPGATLPTPPSLFPPQGMPGIPPPRGPPQQPGACLPSLLGHVIVSDMHNEHFMVGRCYSSLSCASLSALSNL